MGQPRSSHSISATQLFAAAALALAIFIAVVLAQRLTTSIVLWRQLQGLQAEIEANRAESERLEKRKLYVQTDEYVESVARREMKMVRPGEVAVIGEPTLITQTTSSPAVPKEWWERVVGR